MLVRLWIPAMALAAVGCVVSPGAEDADRDVAPIHAPHRAPIDVRDCVDPGARSTCTAIATVRAMAGLAPLRLDAAASRAARLHCSYLELNGELTHTQDPRKPGFTGVTFSDRLAAASFGEAPGGEVIASIHGAAAILGTRGFLNSVYHRAMFLRSETTSYGYGSVGSCTTIDLGRPHDYMTRPIARVVWPPDGAVDVPTTFYSANELPNPLPGTTVVGSPVSVVGVPAGVEVEIRIAVGARELDGMLLTARNDPAKLIRPGEAHFVPLSPLSPRTRYAVTIVVGNETLTSSFTTTK